MTIVRRDATIEEVVADFRRQTNVNILLDKSTLPEDDRIESFSVKDEPFRTALKAFLEVSELWAEWLSPTMVRISRPPRLTFNFTNADVRVVLDMIARTSGASIVVAPEVKGTVTFYCNKVPWMEVLETVARTLGLTVIREDSGVIRIHMER